MENEQTKAEIHNSMEKASFSLLVPTPKLFGSTKNLVFYI